MIKNLPTPQDFETHGIDFLNISWSITMDILIKIFDFEEIEKDVEEEVWESAQRHLATSVLLAHQGCELLLKGRIAEVSPYLLITGNVQTWPNPKKTPIVDYAEFRTVDAQDLIKLHDIASAAPLSEAFCKHYEALRKLRNAVAHTIDKSLEMTAQKSIMHVLEICHELLNDDWFTIRREYLVNGVDSTLYSYEHDQTSISIEGMIIMSLLSPADVSRHLKFNKKQRRYLCPSCLPAIDFNYIDRENTAILSPNLPTSTNVHCFACGVTSSVTRKQCIHDDCKCNVISEDYERCLICDGEQF